MDTHAQTITGTFGTGSKLSADPLELTPVQRRDNAFAAALDGGERVISSRDKLTDAGRNLDSAFALLNSTVHDFILTLLPQSKLDRVRRRLNDKTPLDEADPAKSEDLQEYLKAKGMKLTSAQGANPILGVYHFMVDKAYVNALASDDPPKVIAIEQAAKARTEDDSFNRSVNANAYKVFAAIDMNDKTVLELSRAKVKEVYVAWLEKNPTLTRKAPATNTTAQRQVTQGAAPPPAVEIAPISEGGKRYNFDDTTTEAAEGTAETPANVVKLGSGETETTTGIGDELFEALTGVPAAVLQAGNVAPAIIVPEPTTEAVQTGSEADTANDPGKPVPNANSSDGKVSDWWYEFDKRTIDTKIHRPVSVKLSGSIKRDIGLDEDGDMYLACTMIDGVLTVRGVIPRQ